jgi:hypothetical protein
LPRRWAVLTLLFLVNYNGIKIPLSKLIVTVQGGIQTLEAIRLDDFGIENAGF